MFFWKLHKEAKKKDEIQSPWYAFFLKKKKATPLWGLFSVSMQNIQYVSGLYQLSLVHRTISPKSLRFLMNNDTYSTL